MAKIITTIGPSSEDLGTLQFFAEHQVQIARLNFSHNTPDWHIQTGVKARQAGLELMADLAGPKVLLGDLDYELEVRSGENLILEKQNPEKQYPYWENVNDVEVLILPSLFDVAKFIEKDKIILIDDGKLELVATNVDETRVYAHVNFGGKIRSHKGINLPGTNLGLDFLVERDQKFLKATLPVLKPEIVAPSFVKTLDDLILLENFMKDILKEHNITDYYPKICTKLEMAEAVSEENLHKIIEKSDMIMIARGDLALETFPIHVAVPFLQEKIARVCRETNTPFIVATQMLESMFDHPVPARAEVSDLYRAVIMNRANFIMLSGESAAGKYPRKCVELMEKMILEADSELTGTKKD